MNKVAKKAAYAVILIVFSCIGYVVGLNIERRHKVTVQNQRKSISTIAVVNMDEGIYLGEEQINYASQLINFPNEHFVITGLNDAKNGIDNGLYAAYIVIPEQFSESVTSFENTPQKVILQYKYNKNLDEASSLQAIKDVNNFINILNSNVAYMYMDAVLAEVHRIQDSSATIMTNDNAELQRLESIAASQLIVTSEPVDEVVVSADVSPVDLALYISQNDVLLESLSIGYSDAVQKGKDEYKDIQNANSEVSKATKDFFSLYEMVIKDVATNQTILLETGQSNLGDAIGIYNQEVDEKRATMEEQMSELVEKQRVADEESAQEQLEDILEDALSGSKSVEEKKLNYLQGRWEDAVDLLKQCAQVNVGELNERLLETYQGDVDGQLYSIKYDAYKQGVTDAFAAIEGKISENDPDEDNIDLDEKKFSIQDINNLHLDYSENSLNANTDNYVNDSANIDLSEERLTDVIIEWDTFEVAYPLATVTDAEIGYEGNEGSEEAKEASITLSICDNANETEITNLASTFSGLFALNDVSKEIDNIIQTDFKDALLTENNLQMERLEGSKDVLSNQMSIYEKSLVDFNPFVYVDRANLDRYLGDIQLNTEEMMGAVENNNSEYISYATSIYAVTSENSQLLKEALNNANIQTTFNVEKCIDDLVVERVNINTQNVSMLAGFANSLSYTRVESQENSEVYDYMVNPIISQNAGESIVDKTTVKSEPKFFVKEILMLILIIGIIFCLGEMIISLRRRSKKQE